MIRKHISGIVRTQCTHPKQIQALKVKEMAILGKNEFYRIYTDVRISIDLEYSRPILEIRWTNPLCSRWLSLAH